MQPGQRCRGSDRAAFGATVAPLDVDPINCARKPAVLMRERIVPITSAKVFWLMFAAIGSGHSVIKWA